MLTAGPLALDGFVDEVVIESGISLATSLAFFPDGRMLVLQKDGKIWIADPNTGAKSVYMQLANVDNASEKGLLDITLAPDFDPAASGDDFFYVYYTPLAPKFARIARFQHLEKAGGLTSRGSLASEFEVWRDTDTYLTCCHYGGGLDFGPDGKLWLTSSDKFTAPTPGEGGPTTNLSQDLTKAGGKVIRVNPDGSIPNGADGWPANPFVDPVDDDPHLEGNQDYYDAIWAYGLRNPFRARWDLSSGQFFIGEVGGNQHLLSHEDVHVATLGLPAANYGWPYYEGTPRVQVLDPLGIYAPQHGFVPIEPVDPLFSYPHNGGGASITGGEVYRASQFPAQWQGVYFYGDYTNDTIRYVTFDDQGTPHGSFDFKPTTQIPGVANQVVFVGVGVDGALYYIEFLGDIRRVKHTSANQPPQIAAASVDRTVGPLPLEVHFTAQVADPDGDPLTATWRFGDGSSSNVPAIGGVASATHTYLATGVYSAYLEVNDGTHSSVSQVFSLLAGDVNLAPVIGAIDVSPAIGNPPLAATLTAQVSDPNHDALAYQWFFGDGASSVLTPVPSGGLISTPHNYSRVGAYNAYLVVTDGSLETVKFAPTVTVGVVSAPPIANGLVMLLEADIKVAVSSGNNVSAWLDGSGHGNNLVASGNPQIRLAATPGGLPAVAFDGDGDRVVRDAAEVINSFPTGNQDRTLLTVVNYLDPRGHAGGFAFGAAGNDAAFGLIADGPSGNFAVATGTSSSSLASSVAASGAGWALQSVVLDSGQYSHAVDGLAIDTGSHQFSTDLSGIASRIVLGEAIDGAGFSQLEVAAVLVYDRALNAIELAQIEAYLYQKYFVGNLPPLAGDDEGLTASGAAVVVAALANDLDIDGVLNPASVSLVSPPAHGSVSVDPVSGLFTYRHDGSPGVFDQFTYTVEDEVTAVSNVATVSIHIGSGALVTDGLVLLLESDAGVASGAGGVASWLDSSGRGNDLQTVVGAPQWSLAATPTGMPALSFDGDDSLSREQAVDPLNSLPIGDADRTLTLVVQYDDDAQALAYGDAGNNRAFGAGATGPDGSLSVVTGADSGDIVAAAVGRGAGWMVETIVVSTGQVRHYVNGALVDSAFHVFDTQLARLVVGADVAGENFGDVDVAAAAIYDRALTDAQRQQVEAQLHTKYLRAAPTAAAPGLPVLSLDAMSGALVDVQGAASLWRDLSPRGNDVVASGNRRPTLVPGATPNGADALRFDGNDDRLQRTFADGLSGLPDFNGSRSMFLVARFHDAKGAGGVAFGDRFDNQAYGVGVAPAGDQRGKIVLQGWGQRNDLVTQRQAFDPQSGQSAGWMLLSAIHASDGDSPALNSFLYQDGALIGAFDHQYNTDVHNSTALLTLGQEIAGLDHIQLDVAAMLIYDKALTTTEQTAVEKYLRDRFLGVNLPPQFTGALQRTLAENTSSALTLEGVDPEGNQVVYSIAGGADAALFTLDGPQGDQLSLTSPPDYELPLDADGDNVYWVRISVSDGIDATVVDVTFTVEDVELAGASVVQEGSTYALAIDRLIDPLADPAARLGLDWGDGGPLEILLPVDFPMEVQHFYADDHGPLSIQALRVDASGVTPLAALAIEVQGVAPTAVGSYAAGVEEGSPATVQLLLPFDPSPADVGAGLIYSFDFDNDGAFDVEGSLMISAVVPAGYVLDDPQQTVRVRLADKDGLFTDYLIDIPVDNAAPVVAAGADAQAEAGVLFSRTVTFTDPGDDAPWTVRIDWDGDGQFDQSTTTNQRSLDISHLYDATDIGQSFQVAVEVDDGDGGVARDGMLVSVVANTLRVVEFTPEPSGFVARFNRSLSLPELSLYSSAQKGLPLETADVKLTGAVTGAVRGSLVWDAATHALRFIKSGGPLVADVYAVQLKSGASAVVGEEGGALDGNHDHVPGGDYVAQFSVTGASTWAGLADFSRGPGQQIDLTPINALDVSMPLIIENVAGLHSIEVDVLYNPALLETQAVAALLTPAAQAAGWTLAVNTQQQGILRLNAFGASPLSGSRVIPVDLRLAVRSDAPYGSIDNVRLANLRLNDGAVAGVADAAVMVVAYPGDVDLSGEYTGYDAASIARVAVGLDSGFASHPTVDPVLVADASGNGFYSAYDATLVAQEAIGLDVPAIPPHPVNPQVNVPTSGPLVQLSVGGPAYVTPGQSFVATIDLLAPATAIGEPGVFAMTADLYYDPRTLSLAAGDVSRGDFWTAPEGWAMQARLEPGVVHLIFYRANASQAGGGTIAALNLLARHDALPGDFAPLELQLVEPHEGGLNWEVSGKLMRLTWATDFSRNGAVDNDDLAVWEAGYGAVSPATSPTGDANADGQADGRDFLAWQRDFGASAAASANRAMTVPIGGPQDPPFSWQQAPSLPRERAEFSAVEFDGSVYAFGGLDGHFAGPAGIDVYHMATQTWQTNVSQLPLPRHHFNAVRYGHEVWIVGGKTDDDASGVAQVDVYNLITNAWRRGPDLPEVHWGGPAVVIGDRLHVLTGAIVTNKSSNHHFALDLTDESGGWQDLAKIPKPRVHAAAVAVDGRIFLIGGELHHVHDQDRVDVQVYDPTTNHWSFAAPLPIARSHIEWNTIVYRGEIWSVSGVNSQSVPRGQDQILIYNPQTDSWRMAEKSLPARLVSPAAVVVDQQLLVMGGGVDDWFVGSLRDVWQLNVERPPQPDFDQDGDVDGHDYLSWQRDFGNAGQLVRLQQGDSNLDAVVDTEDRLVWERSFGLFVTQAIPGDPLLAPMNDGTALLAWQRGFGNAGSWLSTAVGDLDGNKVVDQDDLAAWAEAFGSLNVELTLGSPSGEPAGAAAAKAPHDLDGRDDEVWGRSSYRPSLRTQLESARAARDEALAELF